MNSFDTRDRQQYLIKRIALFSGILATIALVFRLYLAELYTIVIMFGVSMLSIYFLVYFLSSNSRYLNFCAWLIVLTNIVGVFFIDFFVGGLTAPFVVLIPIICFIAFFVLKGKTPWGVSFITILAVLTLLYLHLTDYTFPENQLSVSGKQVMTAVWIIIAVMIMSLVIQNLRQQNILLENTLYENSITDHLTGLHNRRYFDQFIQQEIARAKREQASLSMILIDIDYFKLYNDTYGHQAGDDCIQKISQLLRQYFKRSMDIIIRYGGEEFLVVLPHTGQQQAYDLAEGFRHEVMSLNIQHQLSEHNVVTVSLGINTMDGDEQIELEQLIGGADRAMYVSKNKGRNKSAQAEDLTVTGKE